MKPLDITTASANSIQVAGSHYVSEYQHWDLVPDVGMGYFDGQITKYISRWRKKNGLQDVEKSLHFAVKYKELLEARILFAPMRADALKTANCLIRYLDTNSIVGPERLVVTMLTKTHGMEDVIEVIQLIKDIAEQERWRLKNLSEGAEATPAYVNQG